MAWGDRAHWGGTLQTVTAEKAITPARSFVDILLVLLLCLGFEKLFHLFEK